jgi:hypothetical protein
MIAAVTVGLTGCRNSDVLLAEGNSTGGSSTGSSGGQSSTTSSTTATASTSGTGTGTTGGATTSGTTGGGTTTTGTGTTTGGTTCTLDAGGTIYVDGVSGDDSAACCGLGSHVPCRTVWKAMGVIDDAGARDVVIEATVDGGGGDWTPSTEKYPIVLGWGAELHAPGVFFFDPDGGFSWLPDAGDLQCPTQIAAGCSVIWIGPFSQNDTIGYASVIGDTGNPVGVGINAADTLFTPDQSAVVVWNGNSGYLANAHVNTSIFDTDTVFAGALSVEQATLWLGQNHAGSIFGTVTIGDDLSLQDLVPGGVGISCFDCTIRDAPMDAGQSSLIVRGQMLAGLEAWGVFDVSLTGSPVFGTAPAGDGELTCPLIGVDGATIYLEGGGQLTLKNATLQCSQVALGVAFDDVYQGAPTATLDNDLI